MQTCSKPFFGLPLSEVLSELMFLSVAEEEEKKIHPSKDSRLCLVLAAIFSNGARLQTYRWGE